MNFVNEMAQANFSTAANVVECGTVKKHNAGRKAGLVLVSAAIALMTGVGAAKICTDCLTQCVAYADPIEETVSVEMAPSDTPLLVETLKSMGE